MHFAPKMGYEQLYTGSEYVNVFKVQRIPSNNNNKNRQWKWNKEIILRLYFCYGDFSVFVQCAVVSFSFIFISCVHFIKSHAMRKQNKTFFFSFEVNTSCIRLYFFFVCLSCVKKKISRMMRKNLQFNTINISFCVSLSIRQSVQR